MRKIFGAVIAMALVFVSIPADAGRVGGPGNATAVVKPFDNSYFDIKFEAKEAAVIRVIGDHSTDMDCYLYDSEGHAIDNDVGPNDTCLLSWTPAWTGYFKLKIVNLGNAENAFKVITN